MRTLHMQIFTYNLFYAEELRINARENIIKIRTLNLKNKMHSRSAELYKMQWFQTFDSWNTVLDINAPAKVGITWVPSMTKVKDFIDTQHFSSVMLSMPLKKFSLKAMALSTVTKTDDGENSQLDQSDGKNLWDLTKVNIASQCMGFFTFKWQFIISEPPQNSRTEFPGGINFGHFFGAKWVFQVKLACVSQLNIQYQQLRQRTSFFRYNLEPLRACL